jgi:hypothetical protein
MNHRRATIALLSAALIAALNGTARADFTVMASNNATVLPVGPRTNGNPDPTVDPGKFFFNAEGPSNGAFASFGVLDFTVPAGLNVSSITGLTLMLTESNAAFTAPGTLNFYLTQDTTTSINAGTSPLAYNKSFAPEGLGAQLSPNFLIGTGTFNTTGNTGSGTVDTYTLNQLSSAALSYLVGQINSGGDIRLIVTPTSDTVAATFAGYTTNSGPAAEPTLIVSTSVAAVPEPGSLVLMALGLAGVAGAAVFRGWGRIGT